MRATKPTEVLVVGAGPTGLALACLLRRLGVAVRIVDKCPAPSSTSKAIGLQHRVSEVLAWMGVADRFLAQGQTTVAVNGYAGGRRVLRLRLDGIEHKSGHQAFMPRPIILPQPQTEAILDERLRELGGHVERATAFVDFVQGPDEVVSCVRRPDGAEERIAARYLVSCEGSHSLIREQAGIGFAGKTYPHDFVMADVDLDWPMSRDQAHVWFHPDGMLAVFGLPGGRTWRLFIEVGATGAPPEVSLELVQHLLARRTGDAAVRASNAVWLSRFKIHSRMVDRLRHGRVLLAGDAAHLHSPSGGQGITTGIQDASNLAWKLAMVLQSGAPAGLLDTYEEERMPIARHVLHTTDRRTRVQFPRSALGRLARDRVAFPLLSTKPVQARLALALSQLDLSYRKSSLACHHDTAGAVARARVRVRAGDRAPDIVFGRAEPRERASLFDQLQRGGFVAIINGPGTATTRTAAALQRLGVHCLQVTPARRPGNGQLVDCYGDLGRLYGARGEFCYLIRPDGYVGLFARPINERTVRAYLAKLWPADTVDTAWRRSAATVRQASRR